MQERNRDQPFLHLEREVRKAVKERALEKLNCSVLMAKRNNDMDNLDVICIGAAIVDIPLQPVSKISLMWILILLKESQ